MESRRLAKPWVSLCGVQLTWVRDQLSLQGDLVQYYDIGRVYGAVDDEGDGTEHD